MVFEVLKIGSYKQQNDKILTEKAKAKHFRDQLSINGKLSFQEKLLNLGKRTKSVTF